MIAGIYLAAGTSQRMGRQKQALTLGGVCLGSWGLKALIDSSLHIIFIIVKPYDDLAWIAPDLKKSHKIRIITYLGEEKGQAASIKCGIHAAQMIQAEASIIMPSDMPFVPKTHINLLLETYKKNEYDYVAPKSEGIFLPPVIFSESMFRELLTLRGDEGAKNILRESQWRGTCVSIPSDCVIDVDTEVDYMRVVNIFREGGFQV